MRRVVIKMKDGSTREFLEQGRAGGSYGISCTFEGAFVVITDEWGKRVSIPAADIAEVIDTPDRGGW